MTEIAPRAHSLHCWFCGAAADAVERLFLSPIGGMKPAICSGCVDGVAAVDLAYRIDPDAAAVALAALNSRAG